jgi:hypothetical protein
MIFFWVLTAKNLIISETYTQQIYYHQPSFFTPKSFVINTTPQPNNHAIFPGIKPHKDIDSMLAINIAILKGILLTEKKKPRAPISPNQFTRSSRSTQRGTETPTESSVPPTDTQPPTETETPDTPTEPPTDTEPETEETTDPNTATDTEPPGTGTTPTDADYPTDYSTDDSGTVTDPGSLPPEDTASPCYSDPCVTDVMSVGLRKINQRRRKHRRRKPTEKKRNPITSTRALRERRPTSRSQINNRKGR